MLENHPTRSPSMHRPRHRGANSASAVDYSGVQSLPEIWTLAARHFAHRVALDDPHAVGANGAPASTLTYLQLAEQIEQFAAGLQALGVQPGVDETGIPPRIALVADNSPRWLVADQGIMRAGAANVVRSAQAEREELLYILENSGSTGLVVENLKTLQKLRDRLDELPIAFVVLLSEETPPEPQTLKIVNFSAAMALGAETPLQSAPCDRDTLATLMYTSGTTGKPKGVMLTHGNLLHQINTLYAVVQPEPGDRILSILPTWHVYERSAEYLLLSRGCHQIYTNIRYVKSDLKTDKPSYMIGVPRLWESIYEGVQRQFREQPPSKQRLIHNCLALSQRYIRARRLARKLSLENLRPSFLQRLGASLQAASLFPLHRLADRLIYRQVRQATGGRIKQIISGGGSLGRHLDDFFEIIGVELLVGYGLTETSPVTNARRHWHNLRYSAGLPLSGTQVRIVDLETRQPLPPGQQGLVMVRGPQVMRGYYNNPEATAKAIDQDGWFDTGDLGWLAPDNDLVLTGRAKDTIVLSNGENIEPQPIEDACLRSAYIDQIVLVGQDEKALGALIVPNLDALQQWATQQNFSLDLPESVGTPETDASGESFRTAIDLNSKEVQQLLRQELNREVQNRPGYRPDDRIGPFVLILEPFSIENGMLTQTLKIRRPVVAERYRDMINGMFA